MARRDAITGVWLRARSDAAGLALVLAAMSIAPDLAVAQDSDRAIRIGVYENQPKIHTDSDSRPAGFFVDLIETIARREGWRIDYVDCVWTECVEMLAAGELDLMPDVALTGPRADRFAFHDIPVIQSWSQVFTLPQQHLMSFNDLRGRRIAVLDGSVQYEFLRELDAELALGIELVRCASMDEVFRRAAENDADAAVTNHFYGQSNAGRFGLVETPITFNQASLFYAAGPGAGESLLPTIDRYLARWKREPDSPYYQALVRAYTGPPASQWPGWLLPAMIAVLGSLLLLGTVALLLRWRVRQATNDLRRANQQLEHLLASAPVVVYSLKYPGMEVEWVSATVERITGCPVEDASRTEWFDEHVHPDDRERVQAENRAIEPGRTLVQEYRIFDSEGHVRFVHDEKRFLPDREGARTGTIIGSWNDLTEARRQAQQVDFLRHYDRLTGLPNRGRLEWQLERMLEICRTHNAPCFVALLDLDRFKSINDTLGVATGDRILRLTASRMLAWLGDDDLAARFGNDEFCLVLRPGQKPDLEQRLDHLLHVVNTPLPAEGRELLMSASLGVAAYPRDGTTPEQLLLRANQALQVARSAGGDRWLMFEPEHAESGASRLFLESDLRRAIRGEDLMLYYQPQVSLPDRRATGVEALIRWRHPERGMISPGEFIPLAEHTGLIERIDLWVIRTACGQMRRWINAGTDPPGVSINLSAVQMYNDKLPDYIAECLSKTGLAADRITLELTETMLMEYPERSLAVLERLTALGLRISMDDFGTGYSNLAHITRLPIDQIKIDQTLIHGIEQDPRTHTLVAGIIWMADQLGFELIAEGIETESQFEMLVADGCRLGQGYLLARPAPADEIGRRFGGEQRRDESGSR